MMLLHMDAPYHGQPHHGQGAGNSAPATRGKPDYGGPERRATGRDPTACLLGMLDEIDYGMLLVGPDGHISYTNHAARQELDDLHPLRLQGRRLHTLRSQDAAPLQDALAAAQRGLRRLLTLGAPGHRVSISVVPLHGAGGAASPAAGRAPGVATLLVLGKRQVCQSLSVQGFARSVKLTPAEMRVLEGLCQGTRPNDIAKSAGVAVSTVRTQIGSIRAKTGAASIRDLVQQVAVLPPLVGALRNGTDMGGVAQGLASLGAAVVGGSHAAQ